jgi:hypothetical protein
MQREQFTVAATNQWYATPLGSYVSSISDGYVLFTLSGSAGGGTCGWKITNGTVGEMHDWDGGMATFLSAIKAQLRFGSAYMEIYTQMSISGYLTGIITTLTKI